MMYLIFNVNSLSYFHFEKGCGANSLSYFRFEKGLETEMAWKRLFNTLKKIFSHNQPPHYCQARLLSLCAESTIERTFGYSAFEQAFGCALYPFPNVLYETEHVFGISLRANVRLLSHEKYKYKMWGEKYRTLVRQCIPPLNISQKFEIFYKKVLTALYQCVIMFT